MNAAQCADDFGSFRRILPFIAIALVLAGAANLWAECPQITKISATINPSSVIETQPQSFTVTVTLNAPSAGADGCL